MDNTLAEPLEAKINTTQKSMRDRPVRWAILFFTCFFIVSRYYNFDVPQGIQKALQAELELTPIQYNLLYTVYAVPNIVWPLFAGATIDKIGCRLSVLIFGSFVVFGQLFFTIGCYAKSFAMLIIGRMILGIGGEAIVVIKVPIVARWFRPHEQGLATGIMFAACRSGSILQGSMTPFIYKTSESIGLAGAAGAIFAAISLTSGLLWIVFDKKAEDYDKSQNIPRERELNLASIRESDAGNMDAARLKKIFTPLLLVMAINAGLICGTLYTFLGNANKYLQERAGLSGEAAGQYISILYVLSMALSLVFGKLVDIFGRRAHGVTIASSIATISFAMFLLLPDCSGCSTFLFPMLLLGVTLALWAACLFPSITLASKANVVGTSMGFVNIVINIFQAVYPLIGGGVQKDSSEYEHGYYWPVFCYLVGAVGAIVSGVLITLFDKKKLLNAKNVAKNLPSIKLSGEYKFEDAPSSMDQGISHSAVNSS